MTKAIIVVIILFGFVLGGLVSIKPISKFCQENIKAAFLLFVAVVLTVVVLFGIIVFL